MMEICEQPLVSIITPVFNGAQYLEDLIQSVLQQDYPKIEHIIIDDGSTDGGATIAVLKRYPHLRWWSRENRGQYATLNEGIAAAQGSILGIISADDMYVTPSSFGAVVNYWRSHPECDCVYGRTLYIDAEGTEQPVQIEVKGPIPKVLLRYYGFIQHCSLFVRREAIFAQQMFFDPRLRYTGDADWIIRLSSATGNWGYLDLPLSRRRFHPAQTGQTANQEAIMAEHRLISERYGTIYALTLLLRWALDWRSRGLKGMWALRTSGPPALGVLTKDWIGRRKGMRQE